MATEKEPKSFCNFESQNVTMVSSEKGGKTTLRIAMFLKPCDRSISQVSSFPLVSETQSNNGQEEHSNHPKKVLFKGWKNPQRKWGDWFESLCGKHALTWDKTGNLNALWNSLYEIKRNQNLILELVNYWCSQTNTFVFPWGESTITLEDVMIIGGFSVLGEPLNLPLSDDLVAIRNRYLTRRSGFVE